MRPPTLSQNRRWVDPQDFVDPGAVRLGGVTIGPEASIWYQAVLRGDINRITIGRGSNIQDGSVVHLSEAHGCHVGDNVTVGHMAMLHACSIGDVCLIGMGAFILDGAAIVARQMIGAGGGVTRGKQITPGALVMGVPGKVVGESFGVRTSERKR